jgi:hypothetical protein
LPLAAAWLIWFHRSTGCRMLIREPEVPAERTPSLLAVARERMRTRHLSLRTGQRPIRSDR